MTFFTNEITYYCILVSHCINSKKKYIGGQQNKKQFVRTQIQYSRQEI